MHKELKSKRERERERKSNFQLFEGESMKYKGGKDSAFCDPFKEDTFTKTAL